MLVLVASEDRVDETALLREVRQLGLLRIRGATRQQQASRRRKRILLLLLQQLQLAPSQDLVDLCGFPAGAIPPVGLSPPPVVTILDQGLLSRSRSPHVVRGGGGRPDQSCLVSLAMLAQLPGVHVAPVAAVVPSKEAEKEEDPSLSFPSPINGESVAGQPPAQTLFCRGTTRR